MRVTAESCCRINVLTIANLKRGKNRTAVSAGRSIIMVVHHVQRLKVLKCRLFPSPLQGPQTNLRLVSLTFRLIRVPLELHLRRDGADNLLIDQGERPKLG